MSRVLPGLLVAIGVGVASGYYTFQPMIVEEVVAQQHGGDIKAAEAAVEAETGGKKLFNTAVRDLAEKRAAQDEQVKQASALPPAGNDVAPSAAKK
ncbi:hypothetical protein BCR37DRAFT_394820 [Protomyces lactucae-debilis]|uniref:Uncharacterized protein n=1 Tax=Protomyces lactucae-debilis TaxID=2754530 RepID=A0A1Y2F1J2_PROLT|nr:uncharacterized protein BCR37DRAFT_394820 [Protomyces lactucae-debilis]ORY77729.1 hypothetical protein BCR37DRAFT_394820 [Protomyces lactucae-debilis]